jgi:hypothetical protein
MTMPDWLCAMVWRWGFVVRVFGYGLHVKRAKGYVPLFSERYGYRRAYYFAGLRLEFLRPSAPTGEKP